MKLIALDEAAALLAEFGAGAALFANGQVIEARRAGSRAATAFWSAVLAAVGYMPGASGDDVDSAVPAAPDRITHRAWQDDAAVARRARVRKAIPVNAKRIAAKRHRAGIRH
jgi:hypothetical protein